ncbi:unnamed protein product [Triticum turgidum subsp. durum]|uniref:Fe2OG dioxygenase domain-containing protein n=1 Tax=Triticum turgidum subsp. durum TaxID=4567 RepID=A0A9R1C431_TRITD|nr:unnamed protein product [Triticum turgidum subsp. durum]
MASDRLAALKAFDETKAGVKGLVDAGVKAVPDIFRHPPDPLSPCTKVAAIPVVDLSGPRSEVVGAVREAARTAGFFQLVNHGVPEAAMSGMLAAVRRFNEEPAEAKAPYYTRDAGRRVRYNCNADLFRTLLGKWRDTIYMDDVDQLAPGEEEEVLPPACRGVAPKYTAQMRMLGRALFELLSEALGVRRGYLEEEAGCLETLSVAGHYYPACPEPHLTLGAVRHNDPGFLTVLLQDGVGGLQVLTDVEDGDFLQLVSNDRFRSVAHRVVANSVGPRMSVACFFRAKGATVCAPVVMDGGGLPRYRTVTAEELLRSSGKQNGLRDVRL